MARETEPKSFIQGESLSWQRSFDDYPASEWSLTYYFRGAGKGFDVSAAADGDKFEMSVGASVTQTCAVGRYDWQAVASKNDEKIVVTSGTVEIKQGLSIIGAAQIIDSRTQAEKDLAAVREMISGKASKDVQEYAIGNRQLKHISIPDLIALESNLKQRVRREKDAERLRKGGKLFKTVLIRQREK